MDDRDYMNRVRKIDKGLREGHRLRKILLADIHRMLPSTSLNHTHYRTLSILADIGPECMKGLYRHLGIEAGSFTPVADRLINEGLVVRSRDSRDRRRVVLSLTAKGQKTVDNLNAIIVDQMGRRLSVLDDDVILELTSAMGVIRRVNDILQEQHEQ